MRSLRDLRAEHLPLLLKIRQKGAQVSSPVQANHVAGKLRYNLYRQQKSSAASASLCCNSWLVPLTAGHPSKVPGAR